jgi:DNA-binding transcriptional ArsR family regulator
MVRDRRFGDTNLKNVIARLAWSAEDDGSGVEISVSALADDCDLTTRTIQRVLRKARDLGLLHLTDRERGARPKIYRLDIQQLATLPLTATYARRMAGRRWPA